ncbi:hypothetical protein J4446_00045 [Candidatus Woesearchaeota archaeon]|nr:hypothetical protein [Candidatus Woesearchaeota archaeon]
MLDSVKDTLLKRVLFSIERALEQPEYFKSNILVFISKIDEIIELNDRMGNCEKENVSLKLLKTNIINVNNNFFEKEKILKSINELKINGK